MKNSFIWRHIEVMKLEENMRIKLAQTENIDYEQQLIKIGNGTLDANENDEIELDDSICNHSENLEELIETIFPDFENKYNFN